MHNFQGSIWSSFHFKTAIEQPQEILKRIPWSSLSVPQYSEYSERKQNCYKLSLQICQDKEDMFILSSKTMILKQPLCSFLARMLNVWPSATNKCVFRSSCGETEKHISRKGQSMYNIFCLEPAQCYYGF